MRQIPPASALVDADERPSPPEASKADRECQSSLVPRQIPPASACVDAGERPSPLEASATIRDCQGLPAPRRILPASDFVFTGERPSPPAGSVRCSIGGKTVQDRLLLEDVHQSTPMSAPGFDSKRPSPLMILQDCQRSPMSDSGYLTLPVCPPRLVDNLAKGPDCQTVPGELSLAVSFESIDDALCSALMRS